MMHDLSFIAASDRLPLQAISQASARCYHECSFWFCLYRFQHGLPIINSLQMSGIAGMSLVPFADAFNHKSALVKLTGHYAIEPVCFEDSDDASDADQGTSEPEDSSDSAADDKGELTGAAIDAASAGKP